MRLSFFHIFLFSNFSICDTAYPLFNFGCVCLLFISAWMSFLHHNDSNSWLYLCQMILIWLGYTWVFHSYKVSLKFWHRFIEQSFRLCGRRRGWDVSREQHQNMYTIKGETDHQLRLDAWDKRLDLVHWEDLEGAGGEGGGRGDRDGEHM